SCGTFVLYHFLALNARHDWSTGRRANVSPLAAGRARLSGLSIRICPKPYILLSAIRDFFPIAGARETFAEAEKVYSAIGAREKLGMFEADDGHGYNKTRRLAAYDWFGRWLKGARDTDPEPQIEMATPEELRCTPTGQVSTSLGGESVFTLNQKRLEQLKANRLTRLGDLPGKVREAIHYEPPSGPLQVTSY